MMAVVKSLTLARPVVKDSFVVTNIPFLDRKIPDVLSTLYQEDFRPLEAKKVERFQRPPTQMSPWELRYFKEYETEARTSYHPHPLPQITRTSRWNILKTNFQMQTDPAEVTFLTTNSEKFRPQQLQPRRTPIRQPEAIKKIPHVEKTPDSTSRASFIPHHHGPVVKATSKRIEEGFPTIKGDGRLHSSDSQNDSFQGTWGRAAKPVEKPSSVTFGDPGKMVEKDSTYSTSFSWPPGCRPPVVKDHLKLNLGGSSQDLLSATTTEAFCHHNLADPVVVKRRNQTSISLPEGDTFFTTYRSSFPNLNHTKHPVHIPESGLMTKSHVQFGPPCLSGLYYTTTTKEHYSKRDGEQARPVLPLPSKTLSGQGYTWKPSMTKTDFPSLTACKPTPYLSKSNFRFPQTHESFSTRYRENYTTKPLILKRPSRTGSVLILPCSD